MRIVDAPFPDVTITYALGSTSEPTGAATFVRTDADSARLVHMESIESRSINDVVASLAHHVRTEREAAHIEVDYGFRSEWSMIRASVQVLVDTTETGPAIEPLFEQAIPDRDVRVTFVNTLGEGAIHQSDLVSELRFLLDTGRLTIADGIPLTTELLGALGEAGKRRLFRRTVEVTDLRTVRSTNADLLLAVAIGAREATQPPAYFGPVSDQLQATLAQWFDSG